MAEESSLRVLTYMERPELEEQLNEFSGLWPEFIFHGAVSAKYYHHTNSSFARFHLYVVDADDRVLAAALSAPLVWDGTLEGLPAGWDGAVQQAAEDYEAGRTPTALCALGAMARREHGRKGLGAAALGAMKAAAVDSGFDALIAPVRPTLKSRYPLTPIERYVTWRCADGTAFDPWIRTHERIGGTILKPAPASMVIEGRVDEWESWTGLSLPETGTYVIPDALAPIVVDCELDRVRYVEPNVWMLHPIR